MFKRFDLPDSATYKRLQHKSSLLRQELEVDAVIGDALVAIEFNSCSEVQKRHLGELKAFKEKHPDCHTIVVSMDERPRLLQGVEIYPVKHFLQMCCGMTKLSILSSCKYLFVAF